MRDITLNIDMSKFEITTMIGCPLMCKFCPQDKLLSAYRDPVRVMTFDTFKTALEKIPKDFSIIFAGFTEPWSNKQCTDFVEYAVNTGRRVGIYSTLFRMTREDVDRLVKLFSAYPDQLTEFWVHLPDALGNMVGWRPSDDYEYALATLKDNLKVHCMTMDQRNQKHPDIKNNVKTAQWYLHTRADNLDVTVLDNQPYHKPPTYEFIVECTRDKNLTSNVLLPNGDLSLCCMDYGLKHIIGNILTQTYDEIINGPALEKIKQLNNTLGYTNEVLCKSCNDGHCRTPWNDTDVYNRVAIEAPHLLGL